jgi:hypothetical protein
LLLYSSHLPLGVPNGPVIYSTSIASLKDDTTQVVNGQRLKHYIAGDSYSEDVDVIETVSPEEFIQDNLHKPAEFVFE